MDEGLCWPDVLPTTGPGAKPEDWFASPATPAHTRAVSLCEQCPRMERCRDYARSEGIPDGIYGGETPADRRRHWGAAGPPKDHLAGLYLQLDLLHRVRRVETTEEVA